MRTASAAYSRAVATLRPSRARMAAVGAQIQAERVAADETLDALLAAGESLQAIYARLCAARPARGLPDPDMVLRATIVGRLRRLPQVAVD